MTKIRLTENNVAALELELCLENQILYFVVVQTIFENFGFTLNNLKIIFHEQFCKSIIFNEFLTYSKFQFWI